MAFDTSGGYHLTRELADRVDEGRPTEEQIQKYLAEGGGSELHQAVLLGDVERVRRLLAAGHDPNDSSGTRGLTPLFYACGFWGVGLSDGDYAGCVAELIRAGAEVNVVCEFDFDRPPLSYIHARRFDAPGIAKVMVDAGANVNVRCRYGMRKPVVADLPPDKYGVRMLRASRRATPFFLRAGAEIAADRGRVPYAPLRYQTSNGAPFWDPYLQKIHDTPGGFKAYEKQHLQAMTAIFEPKFPQLPKEVVRHLMTFCFHLGFYVYNDSEYSDGDDDDTA